MATDPNQMDAAELRAEVERLRAQQAGGAGGATVTRNVPPMRVVVSPGQTVAYAGQSYTEGQEFLHGEGGVAQALEVAGHVTITNRDATNEWNAKAGEDIRKAAHAIALDATDADKLDHDHGFAKFTPGDDHATPMDVTAQRQAAARDHLALGREMTEEEA